MSKLKGLFAALLLAVAPVTMAITVDPDADLNVSIGGPIETFAGFIKADGEFQYKLHLTPVGAQGTVFTWNSTYLKSQDSDGSLVGMDLWTMEGNWIATATKSAAETFGGLTRFSLDLNVFLTGGDYILRLTGEQNDSFSGNISAVPLPGAALLFGSAVFGAGVFSRRRAGHKAEAIAA